MKTLMILFFLIVAASAAYPHGGGLDSLGCHNDRKNGDYHCHRGPLAGRSFSSKAEAEKELQKQRPQPKEPEKPKVSN
ncbi:MAG: YHYH domain-containing protein [Acidobacteria bacterium]|nr:YHYH domain-containing protein [Acidobacteriota bacterium]